MLGILGKESTATSKEDNEWDKLKSCEVFSYLYIREASLKKSEWKSLELGGQMRVAGVAVKPTAYDSHRFHIHQTVH